MSARDAGVVGALGQLRPDVAAAHGVDDLAVYFASLDMDRLAARCARDRRLRRSGRLSTGVAGSRRGRGPGGTGGGSRGADPPRRRQARARVAVFDVYEGDQVPAGKRSLALRVVMRSPERTLNEKDIAGVRAKILKSLEREYGAGLR